MRVAFPLKNKTELAIDFVKCQSIGIYDEFSQCVEILAFNDKSATSFLDKIKAKGVDCIISPDFSCNELRTLRENNIITYKAWGEEIEENVIKLFSRTLRLFNRFDRYHVDNCHSDCLGCGYR